MENRTRRSSYKSFVAPGNAGTATENKCENVALDILDNPAIIDFAKNNAVELIIVGPEAPLVNGVVDACREADVKFGIQRSLLHSLKALRLLPSTSLNATTFQQLSMTYLLK